MLLVNTLLKRFASDILRLFLKVTSHLHQSKYINVSIFATRKS